MAKRVIWGSIAAIDISIVVVILLAVIGYDSVMVALLNAIFRVLRVQ